ncbi:unnamed protein product [Soboliphyme baturini]|uniref:Innexin n=1 Tax=Soboliphyme baturini TaxID=241478 RepID=A0A183IBY9_9BILA|nr:unnamed protein product [Soboliphyme baturini]
MDLFSSAIESLKPALDDDLIDRFNHYYTPNVFLLFALVVITRQWIGHPIQCWVPAEFKRAWEEYTENYCFTQNTYWLSINSSIPEHQSERNGKRICYYQWVPFILATQALMFCIPHLVWRLLSFYSGVNWRYSGIFPVVTMCDFDVRMLGQSNRYTVQCVLMINVFNEKIFAFLWIWVALLSALNVYHVIYWIIYAAFRDLRTAYVAKLLDPTGRDTRGEEEEQTEEIRMVTKFLRTDGFLILRKVASHSGKVVAAKLLRNLLKEVQAENNTMNHIVRARTVSTSTITRTTFV